MSGSLGGGKSKNSSRSTQQSQSTSESQGTSQSYGSNVWGGQSPYLESLYAQASNLNQNPGQNPYQQMGDMLMNQGANTLNAMQNQGIDPAVNAYARNMGEQYRQQFLPQLQGQAIQAGGLGNSRQQIGAALGAGQAMDAISDFSANSYAGQQERALQAAQAGMNQGMAATDFGLSLPWYNLNQFAGLLGGPTMQDLGSYAQNTSKSQSTSKGTSTGKGSSWNMNGSFGMGPA